MRLFVPSYIEKIVKEHWNGVENISLKIERFIPFGGDSPKKRGGEMPKPKYQSLGYRILLPTGALEKYQKYYKLRGKMWDEINAQTFKLSTKSRLIIGLGNESVYETSIRLHRNYGIPYIPGSALKGVAKHYAILNLADRLKDQFDGDFFELAKRIQEALENPAKDENNDKEVIKAIEEKLKEKINDELLKKMKVLRAIFGTQKREGDIIFFDAFPTPNQLSREPILELDIMNPHYQPYYSASGEELGKKVEMAPGDWHSPVPVFFLTVPAGIEFQFSIAPRNKEGVKLLTKARELLISALKEHGVGAKTSLGYGRFG